MASLPNEHEEKLVAAFMCKEIQDRYRFLLGHPKRRWQGLNRLYHCWDFNEKYAQRLPSNARVLSLLQEAGSPPQAYVLSTWPHLDGHTMPLEDAVQEILALGGGNIVSCLPGELAFYGGEVRDHALLQRKPES